MQLLLPLCLLLSADNLWANTATVSRQLEWWGDNMTTLALLGLIGFELWLIVYFAAKMNQLLDKKGDAVPKHAPSSIWLRIRETWTRMNFRPIEEEATLDTGHSYDGIRELNNVTPPWFTTAFVLSILFAFIYLYRFHVAKTAPLMLEEYEISIQKAELAHEEYLKNQANSIDENNIMVMTGIDLNEGKNIFISLCAVCHRPDGGGQVGPNLTDDYWIHGGSLKDVFTTVKYGVPDKGMISWKAQLSPQQIAQVSNYIMTLHGTNPVDPKEKQGVLYVAEVMTKQDSLIADTMGTAGTVDTLSIQQTK